VSGAITALILVSLWSDTRLTKSVELLRRGELSAATVGFRRVADTAHRLAPQRYRAYGYLAAIAWRKADHDAALGWIRARRRALERTGAGTSDERWATEATEVWLLALLGLAADAEAALQRLPAAPPDAEAKRVEITARLLVAFARDEADELRPQLRRWAGFCEDHDRLGLASAALAWAFDATGDRDAAWTLAERTRARADHDHLHTHAPRLHRWLSTYGHSQPYGR
jgi:hypothetical protein